MLRLWKGEESSHLFGLVSGSSINNTIRPFTVWKLTLLLAQILYFMMCQENVFLPILNYYVTSLFLLLPMLLKLLSKVVQEFQMFQKLKINSSISLKYYIHFIFKKKKIQGQFSFIGFCGLDTSESVCPTIGVT